MSRSDFNRAKPLLEEMLTSEPDWAHGIVLRALLDARDGDPKALADNLRDFFPPGPEPHVLQGDVLMVAECFNDASIAYDRAL